MNTDMATLLHTHIDTFIRLETVVRQRVRELCSPQLAPFVCMYINRLNDRVPTTPQTHDIHFCAVNASGASVTVQVAGVFAAVVSTTTVVT